MPRYAPNAKDLASRDVVSRAIYDEVQAGNGVNGKDYVYLDIRPEVVNKYKNEDKRNAPDIDGAYVEKKLPDILDFCRTYLGVDPVHEPMPIQPTAHYAMGGIPTNVDAEFAKDENWTVFPGLYAAGEGACVSIHGAIRLGTNALLDLVVFGRRGGMKIAQDSKHMDWTELPKDAGKKVEAEFNRLRTRKGKTKAYELRQEMQKLMMDKVGVYRTDSTLTEAITQLGELKQRYYKDLAG